MKKRLLSLFLALALLLSLLPIGAAAESEEVHQYGDQFYYTIENGEVTITGQVIVYDPCPLYACTDVVIPDYIDGYPVTTIGQGAFWHVSGVQNLLESIVLPDTLTTLEANCFRNCTGLTEITIPDSVTEQGGSCFLGCTGLKKITIGTLSSTTAETRFKDWRMFESSSPEVLVLGRNITEACDSWGIKLSNLKELYVSSSVRNLQTEFSSYVTDVTIYGYTGSAAEAYAEKYGNPFVALDEDVPKTVDLVASVPERGSTAVVVSNGLSLTFSRTISINLNWPLGSIYIKDYATDETVLEIDDKVFFSLGGSVSGCTVTIPKAFSSLSPGKYYILIDEGLITADKQDSDHIIRGFAGITKKDALAFTKVSSAGNPVYSCDMVISTGLDASQGNTTATVEVPWDDAWFENSTVTYNDQLATTAMALSGAAYVDVSEANIQTALTDLGFGTLYSDYTVPTELDNDIVSYSFGTKPLYDGDGNFFNLVAIVIKGTSSNEEWYSNFNIGTGSTHQGFQRASTKLLTALNRYLEDNGITNPRFLVTGHSRGAAVANLTAAELTQEYGQEDVYAYTFASPTVSQSAQESGYENIFNIINGEDFVPQVPLKRWGFSRYGIDLQLPSRSYYGSDYDAVFNTVNLTYQKLTGTDYPAYSSGIEDVEGLVSDVYSLAKNVNQYYNTARSLFLDIDGTMADYFDVLCAMLVDGSTKNTTMFLSTLWGDYNPITEFFAVHQNGILSSSVLGAHGMASYFSWLSTFSGEILFGSTNSRTASTFKRLKVACPVDVYVYDESGTLVCSIVDDEVIANTLAASVEDSVKTIDLPEDQSYDVKVVATDAGTVNYTVEECALDGTASQELLNCADIPISAGDVITAQVSPEAEAQDSTLVPQKGGVPVVELPDTPSQTENPFTDVLERHYFYDAVLWAAARGITSGTTATTFSPSATCTREQVVTFLWRAKGCPEPRISSNPFTDVKESGYAYKAILWAYENGITAGTTETTFSPTASCTRGQVVTFLWRAEGEPTPSRLQNPFYDVTAAQYYFTPVRWAASAGITSGTTETTFSPKDSCTRGQIVTFLYRDMGE